MECMTFSGMASPDASPFIRPMAIVRQYGTSERTLRRWIANGDLDIVRVGRSVFVTRESLDRLFSGRDSEAGV
jgi:excisionase family DNA binding protein